MAYQKFQHIPGWLKVSINFGTKCSAVLQLLLVIWWLLWIEIVVSTILWKSHAGWICVGVGELSSNSKVLIYRFDRKLQMRLAIFFCVFPQWKKIKIRFFLENSVRTSGEKNDFASSKFPPENYFSRKKKLPINTSVWVSVKMTITNIWRTKLKAWHDFVGYVYYNCCLNIAHCFVFGWNFSAFTFGFEKTRYFKFQIWNYVGGIVFGWKFIAHWAKFHLQLEIVSIFLVINMFIRLSLLRHYPEAHIKWHKGLLNPSELIAKTKLLQRHCGDVKRTEELLFSGHGAGIVVPSPLRIKQTIKSGFNDFVDGPTCIQTSCPTCPPSLSQAEITQLDGKKLDHTKDEKCLFINKTTGNDLFLMVFFVIFLNRTMIDNLKLDVQCIFRWCCVFEMSARF